MAGAIPLPPAAPPMWLRFTISAAFSTLALTLLPFFLVGLLLRCIFAPLTNMYESWTAPKYRRKSKKTNKAVAAAKAAAAANGTANANANTATTNGLARTSSLRISSMPPPPRTAAQLYASSARLSPPSPASSMSSVSTASRRSS